MSCDTEVGIILQELLYSSCYTGVVTQFFQIFLFWRQAQSGGGLGNVSLWGDCACRTHKRMANSFAR